MESSIDALVSYFITEKLEKNLLLHMIGYNVKKENAEFKYPTLYKYSCQMLLLNMINI